MKLHVVGKGNNKKKTNSTITRTDNLFIPISLQSDDVNL